VFRLATFTIDDRDLEDLIRRDIWHSVRQQGPRPAAALGAALVLLWFQPFLAAIAFGMGLAWTYSLFEVVRQVRPWYASHHGSRAGPLTIEFRDEGLFAVMPLGQGVTRWDQLDSIKNYPSCFVLEFDGDEIMILPKRHFTAEELIILQSKATEIASRHAQTNQKAG
jgi:YcxB-like protein